MTASPAKHKKRNRLVLILLLLAAAYLGLTPNGRQQVSRLWEYIKPEEGKIAKAPRPDTMTGFLPVVTGDVDIYLEGLGDVTPMQSVTVRSRVEGELLKLGFREGDLIREGQVIAELDPRPYEAALMQAEGQLARDTALYENAKKDLERYRKLLAQDAIARQEVDNQEATAAQYAATILSDRGNVEAARLQLGYTKIISPLTGRVGLRQVDTGNIIRPNEENGIVTITQEDPISVMFYISEVYLPDITGPVRQGQKLEVEAWDRDYREKIAAGVLETIDNSVDKETGMFKLRARFDNAEGRLFPNQFVNIRLKLKTLEGVPLIRDVSTRRGTMGDFVYVLNADNKAEVRPVKLGPAKGNMLSVLSGLKPGERVAIDGVDRLREGLPVSPVDRSLPQPQTGSEDK